MRKDNKYKLVNSTGGSLKMFPLRVLKFKRPKWAKVKKVYAQTSQRKRSLIDILSIKKSLKSWDKIKKYYKKGIQNKNIIYCLFNKAEKFSRLKNKLSNSVTRKDFISNYLVRLEFRIDVFLFHANFFSSVHEARQNISNNKVLINEKTVKPNYYLKKGDIISYDFVFNYNLLSNKHSITEKLLSFIEVDYYTNTAVVIKDFSDLSSEDFYLIITDYVNIKNLSYNI